MIVTCPNCQTTYNLPDGKAAPGAKLRCTVCKHIFAMEAPKPSLPLDDLGLNLDDAPAKRKKKKAPKSGGKKRPIVLLLLLVLLCGGAAAAWFLTPWLDSVKAMILGNSAMTSSSAQQEEDITQMVGKLTFSGVRQFTLPNEKIGKLTVIEGKVVNGFTELRDLINLEATLYDKDNKVVVSKTQLAGTYVSLFQLQVLSEKELEQALNNKLDILSNNTNVAPGAQVPFMIVLFNPPDTATDFTIKAVGAKKSQPQK